MKNQPDSSDVLRLASLIAHQLQSPISAVGSLLNVLGGEFVGPLTAAQKDLIDRASVRCAEGGATIRRMLAIVSAMGHQGQAVGVTDLAAMTHRV